MAAGSGFVPKVWVLGFCFRRKHDFGFMVMAG